MRRGAASYVDTVLPIRGENRAAYSGLPTSGYGSVVDAAKMDFVPFFSHPRHPFFPQTLSRVPKPVRSAQQSRSLRLEYKPFPRSIKK